MRFATSIVPACVLAALIGGTEVRAQDQEPLVIEVNMADYSFSPAPLRIPAGRPVMLVFTNTGNVDHEFMAGRTVANGDFEVDLFAGLEVEIQAAPAADHADAEPHEHAPGTPDHDHPDTDVDAADHDHADTDAGDHDHADATDDDHADAEPHEHADDAAPHEHGADDGHGTMVLLEDGDGRMTMTFTLPTDRRGEWEMACFITRHYERGMHGILTVY